MRRGVVGGVLLVVVVVLVLDDGVLVVLVPVSVSWSALEFGSATIAGGWRAAARRVGPRVVFSPPAAGRPRPGVGGQ
ncbi:hypothetical protein [Streptomyces sp. NPDC127098]|uniref:hypothetical protein n=1 Tax=Streptomyces sp. NPDC127098 TaxID=3347137 RepID=UPI00365EAC33